MLPQDFIQTTRFAAILLTEQYAVQNGDRDKEYSRKYGEYAVLCQFISGNTEVTTLNSVYHCADFEERNIMKNTYKNLEVQFNKLFRHLKTGSFKTRERYAKVFRRFMVFLADRYNLQKLSNISKKHIFTYVEYMQHRGLSASTIKTELAAIRFFHDNMPYTRLALPTNDELDLKRRTFSGVDRTWTDREYNLMLAVAMECGHKDYTAILALARYAGLRLEECFRIDTNDANNVLDSGKLFVKGKGGLTRYVPINESIRIYLTDILKETHVGQKLFVKPEDKTHLAMKRLQCFIAYHRKEFTDNRITFHGLRHKFSHEQYEKLIQTGFSDFAARKKVSELLGHHRDDVTRIYLSEGE